MGTGPFRPMRTGGGGPRYLMPMYEDGSSYGPGDPVYDWIEHQYSVTDWNAMPDADRERAVNAVEQATWNQRPQQGTPYGPPSNVNLNTFLNQLQRGAENPSVSPLLEGLFGGGSTVTPQYSTD